MQAQRELCVGVLKVNLCEEIMLSYSYISQMSKCVSKVILRVIYTERLNRFIWGFPLLKKYCVIKEFLEVFSYYYIGWPEFYSRKVPCRSISGKDDEAMKYGLKQHIYFSCYYSVAQIGVLFHTVILFSFGKYKWAFRMMNLHHWTWLIICHSLKYFHQIIHLQN
jgi:hypothetical protein